MSRILFDGNRAIGVQYADKSDFTLSGKVARGTEIIVSGGAINSPQLLLLSGIGDANHLRVRAKSQCRRK